MKWGLDKGKLAFWLFRRLVIRLITMLYKLLRPCNSNLNVKESCEEVSVACFMVPAPEFVCKYCGKARTKFGAFDDGIPSGYVTNQSSTTPVASRTVASNKITWNKVVSWNVPKRRRSWVISTYATYATMQLVAMRTSKAKLWILWFSKEHSWRIVTLLKCVFNMRTFLKNRWLITIYILYLLWLFLEPTANTPQPEMIPFHFKITRNCLLHILRRSKIIPMSKHHTMSSWR